MKKKKPTWGGARKKAPEKYAVPTTVRRVPDPILPEVDEIIKEFRKK